MNTEVRKYYQNFNLGGAIMNYFAIQPLDFMPKCDPAPHHKRGQLKISH
jgi:hypothetical protein